MAALFEHQREALAVAAQRNVLLCGARRVGKTFLAALRVREWLLATAAAHPSTSALAVAPTAEMRAALQREVARACSNAVWTEADDAPDAADLLAARLRGGGSRRVRVAIVSPRLFQALLRKRLIRMGDIGLLVFEGADEIHESTPSLFRLAFEPVRVAGATLAAAPENELPRIFATSRAPASALAWDPHQNPLLRHIHVLNLIPVVSPDAVAVLRGLALPSLPLLLPEPFEPEVDPSATLSCAVRDFLLGENDKKIDFVRIFRMELEMGNSAAVYDDRKKQERTNRFIADAETVYQHLGLWCLLKFVELELQFNLHACLVDDVDSINRRRRWKLLLQRGQSETEAGGEELPGRENEDDDAEEQGEEESSESGSLAALVESTSPTLDEIKLGKIKLIIKVLGTLASAANKLGADAATPRLLKVAAITRNRLAVAVPAGQEPSPWARCWVFVERRVHCTVVAEYLSFALNDLDIPPCCSMLGHSNARIVGSLHFSSYLKIITLFSNGGTNVLVTTSIATTSQRVRVEPPQCDIVIVMDEIQEADKLLGYCRRAYAANGAVKVVLPQGRPDMKKFQLLVHKLKELMQEETPLAVDSVDGGTVQAISTTPTPRPNARKAQFSVQGGSISTRDASGAHNDGDTAVSVVSFTKGGTSRAGNDDDAAVSAVPPPLAAREVPPLVKPVPIRAYPPRVAAAPTPVVTYEIFNKDTGAVLNLENSVKILSKFCETIPGLDTYDRHAQYYIKRHPISGPTMTASMKQMKKKKFKYNSKLDDKIDDLAARAEAKKAAQETGDDVDMPTVVDESYSSSGRFLFTAKLRLPLALNMKKEIGSPKVSSDVEAKAIVAFKACQELVKRGLLDRHFKSLIEHDPSPESADDSPADKTIYVDEEGSGSKRLADLSAQNSYDLPPVSAAELGLPTVRSLMVSAKSTEAPEGGEVSGSEVAVSMCFYGIEGIRFAILSSKELYTGNTNTGWRYDFATSDVMAPVVNRVTLQKTPTPMQLTKAELELVLRFHLITMRLACMNVDDAMREVDIQGDKVWNEFSEQNDKGYLVVPSHTDEAGTLALDWDYVREIVGEPLLVNCWPLPEPQEWPSDEWVCVPKNRRNVYYVVREIMDEKAGDAVQPMAELESSWTSNLKSKAVPGVPIFGRWHTREQVTEADPSQPLVHVVQVPAIVPLIRRVMQRNHDEASVAQSKTKFQERFLLPELTSLLRVRKTRFFEAMGIVPLLYEFERKCQMSNLMRRIGLELDLKLLDDATTKPNYERLEILGDTFLKLETSWFLFQHRPDVTEEGQLTQLRRDIIRNDRLNMFALAKKLHHYILYPAEIEQHPFKFWKPSCMGQTPDNIVAPSKWIADVLEAMCGAYLVGQNEAGARQFLRWVGVTVPEVSHSFHEPYYPDYLPNEIDADTTPAGRARQRDLGFHVEDFEDIPDRLEAMQQRLKYTFSNKLLLLEALTHPSVGLLMISRGDAKPKPWRRNYERLEYLGDAIIEYLTLSYAFVSNAKWLPGSLSQWKSATVSNDALGKTAIACFGVDECLLAGALKMDRESIALVGAMERRYPRSETLARSKLHGVLPTAKKKKPPTEKAINTLALPKMFADVFEALVAAVFLDSGHSLQTVRDVFLGPLVDVVGRDAFAYVCRESGLPMGDDPLMAGDDFDMEELRLFSDDEEDD